MRKRWTQDEFFPWAERQDLGYELDGDQPVLIPPATVGHGLIAANLRCAPGVRLRGGPCRALGLGVGVATVGTSVRYPDAVICPVRQDPLSRLLAGVVAAFEILVDDTIRTDLIVKPREYAAVPSMRRYVILESTSVGLVVLEREQADESWRMHTLTGRDDVLRIQEVGISIPVAEVYEGLRLP